MSGKAQPLKILCFKIQNTMNRDRVQGWISCLESPSEGLGVWSGVDSRLESPSEGLGVWSGVDSHLESPSEGLGVWFTSVHLLEIGVPLSCAESGCGLEH